MTYKILFDQSSLQAVAHYQKIITSQGDKIENPNYMARLNSFLKILENVRSEVNKEMEIDFGEISNDLKNYDLLMVLTRFIPFTNEQLDIITNFLSNGGNLLLMSNHNPLDMHDNQLSSIIGVKLTGGFWSGTRGQYTIIENDNLTKNPILTNNNDEVGKIVTNTTCAIQTKIGSPIAYLPVKMEGRWSSENVILSDFNEHQRIFGLSMDGSKGKVPNLSGKAIILADSGFIGDVGSIWPGHGMIDEGDNRIFLKNIFRYLIQN